MESKIVFEGSLDFYKHTNGMYFICPKKVECLEKKEMNYHIIEGGHEKFTATSISSEPGHIIVFGETIEEAKEKFKNAFNHTCVMAGLIALIPDKEKFMEDLKNKKE